MSECEFECAKKSRPKRGILYLRRNESTARNVSLPFPVKYQSRTINILDGWDGVKQLEKVGFNFEITR